jgi:hypothetical protein
LSKADLLRSDDFLEYQEDLKKRLDAHIRDLHKIISEPIGSFAETETKLLRLEAKRALIVEVELILGIPVGYLKEEEKPAAQQKGAKTFMEMFRAIFARENP